MIRLVLSTVIYLDLYGLVYSAVVVKKGVGSNSHFWIDYFLIEHNNFLNKITVLEY